MMNWGDKVRVLLYEEIRPQDESTESKIMGFGLEFTKKSKSEIEEEISFAKREKI